jgi:hypothetical protein
LSIDASKRRGFQLVPKNVDVTLRPSPSSDASKKALEPPD